MKFPLLYVLLRFNVKLCTLASSGINSVWARHFKSRLFYHIFCAVCKFCHMIVRIGRVLTVSGFLVLFPSQLLCANQFLNIACECLKVAFGLAAGLPWGSVSMYESKSYHKALLDHVARLKV